MMRRALFLSALSLLACTACNDGHAPPASPATETGAAGAAGSAAETVIHADDDGKSFDAYRGSTVTFKLASNSGTGYVWMPTQVDPAILAQQGDRTSEIPSDVPGAPKLDVYRFTAGAAGSTTVEMSLKRPFGSAPVARAIHVTVNVR